jgi:glutamine amidotransferase
MCQLLALAFNEPVTPALSFRGFRHRANCNPHGWGLASFTGSTATITKEPARADRSDVVESILENHKLSSRIFIGHVRYGNVGGVSMLNTHPFAKQLRGKDFVLAHNGTLDKDQLEPQMNGRHTPDGTTDSELALCVLADWLIGEDCAFTDFARIHDRLRDLNDYGNMNLLFSEGEHLFAYHDANGYKGLCCTRRKSPFPRVTLRDEDWTANLPEEKSPSQHGYVIATKPLTNGEMWTNFGHGGLKVFRNGKIVYQD